MRRGGRRGIYALSALALSQSLVSADVANSGSDGIQLNASGGGIFAAGVAVADSIVASNVVNAGARIGLLNLSLAEVAACAGFSDQGHLCHHFKRAVGVTPGQFRVSARIAQRPASPAKKPGGRAPYHAQ